MGDVTDNTQSYEELRHAMSLAGREAAERDASAIIASTPLRTLRRNRGFSQDSVSEKMRANQATISKLERRGDIAVSTLRKYIEALGGNLRVRAEFQDEVIDLDLGGTEHVAQSERAPAAAVTAERDIVAALRASGWDPYDVRYVRRNVAAESARFDLVLYGAHGVLAVIAVTANSPGSADTRSLFSDAKRIDALFAIFTCGDRHWICETKSATPIFERIQRLPARSDLERVKRRNAKVAMTLQSFVDTEFASRKRPLLRHQENAVKSVADAFDAGRRRFLVAMATGTGKTAVYASLMRSFLKTHNAERILVIANRVDASQQARDALRRALPDVHVVLYAAAADARFAIGPTIVIATVSSLSRDRRYESQFSPLAFDLIVDIDAHRAAHVAGREMLQYFVAPRIGFISTAGRLLFPSNLSLFGVRDPRFREARALRDTYGFFGCVPASPTYCYDVTDAIMQQDGPFIAPRLIDSRISLTTVALARKGWDRELSDLEAALRLPDAMRKLFTYDRNRAMVATFLKRARRLDDGTVGRSVVFALNHEHAEQLASIFNENIADCAVTITGRVPNAATIARSFAESRLSQRVAIGVDLLAAGLPYQNLGNVAIMRPVFSAREYEAIKGCALRARSSAEEPTSLLDFLGVAEYFGERYAEESLEQFPIVKALIPSSGRARSAASETAAVMKLRDAFRLDIKALFDSMPRFRGAVERRDDDLVEKLIEEHLLDHSPLFYSELQIAAGYGVPAAVSAMAYDALGKALLPTADSVVREVIAALGARFDLRWKEERLLYELFDVVLSDSRALRSFIDGDVSVFKKARFRELGGLRALSSLASASSILDAVRESALIRLASLRLLSAA